MKWNEYTASASDLGSITRECQTVVIEIQLNRRMWAHKEKRFGWISKRKTWPFSRVLGGNLIGQLRPQVVPPIAIWLHCDANCGIKHEICGKYGFSKCPWQANVIIVDRWPQKSRDCTQNEKNRTLPETPSVELVCGWLRFFWSAVVALRWCNQIGGKKILSIEGVQKGVQ